MHEDANEAILPNSFSKQLSFTKKAACDLIRKLTFTCMILLPNIKHSEKNQYNLEKYSIDAYTYGLNSIKKFILKSCF